MGILEKTAATGGGVLDRIGRDKLAEELSVEASELEAEAVARAIGIPSEFSASRVLRQRRGSAASESVPLSRVASTRSDYTSGAESPSPVGGLSPDPALLDGPSPDFEQLDSTGISSEEEKEEEEKEDERSEKGEVEEGEEENEEGTFLVHGNEREAEAIGASDTTDERPADAKSGKESR